MVKLRLVAAPLFVIAIYALTILPNRPAASPLRLRYRKRRSLGGVPGHRHLALPERKPIAPLHFNLNPPISKLHFQVESAKYKPRKVLSGSCV